MNKGLWLEGKGVLLIDEVPLDLWKLKVILEVIKYKGFTRATHIYQFWQTVAFIPGFLQNGFFPRNIGLAPFLISLLIGQNSYSCSHSSRSSAELQAFCYWAEILWYNAVFQVWSYIVTMIFFLPMSFCMFLF